MKKFAVLSAFLLIFVLGLNAQNKVVAKYVDNPKVETVKLSKEMMSMLGAQSGMEGLLDSMMIESLDGVIALICRDAEFGGKMYDDVFSNVTKDKSYVEMLKDVSGSRSICGYGKKKNGVYRELLLLIKSKMATVVVEISGKFEEK